MKKGYGNKMIDSIKGTFLSNFYENGVRYEGLWYRNAESAFQASKCKDKIDRVKFQNLTGAQAKALGKTVVLRDDWNDVKVRVMYEILCAKFESTEILRIWLLETGDQEIIEGNSWGDTFWGVCNGKGQNQLGKLLMGIREEYKVNG
jgi:ribA/ribD-fused uncharacterized protein